MPQLPVEVVCWTSLRASPFIAEMVIRYAIMHAASLQYIWQREAYCAPKLWAMGPHSLCMQRWLPFRTIFCIEGSFICHQGLQRFD